MDQQAPQVVSPPPPSQEPSQPPPEPTGAPESGPSREVVQTRQLEIEAKRKAITENARAKMRAEFRQSQGLPAPTPPASPVPAGSVPSDGLQAAPAPGAPTTPTPNTGALAEAITANLQKQFRDAEALRTEAATMAAEAQRKVQAAEAKVAAWQQNPAAYLQEQGLSMDQWQARLLNGGEPTAEEKLRADVMGKVDPALAELKQEVANLRAQAYGVQRTKVVQELSPLLAKDFPIVNRLLGPEGVLRHLEEVRDTTKQNVNPQATLAALESRFLQQYQETLQDPAVASKVMPSVTKSPQVEAAAQSPQTLTNRVTSTVPSSSSRPTTEKERFARGREEIRKLLAAGRL